MLHNYKKMLNGINSCWVVQNELLMISSYQIGGYGLFLIPKRCVDVISWIQEKRKKLRKKQDYKQSLCYLPRDKVYNTNWEYLKRNNE